MWQIQMILDKADGKTREGEIEYTMTTALYYHEKMSLVRCLQLYKASPDCSADCCVVSFVTF